MAPRTEGMRWKRTRMQTSNGVDDNDAAADDAGADDILEMSNAQDNLMEQGKLPSMFEADDII